jgi:hypothetical protein
VVGVNRFEARVSVDGARALSRLAARRGSPTVEIEAAPDDPLDRGSEVA